MMVTIKVVMIVPTRAALQLAGMEFCETKAILVRNATTATIERATGVDEPVSVKAVEMDRSIPAKSAMIATKIMLMLAPTAAYSPPVVMAYAASIYLKVKMVMKPVMMPTEMTKTPAETPASLPVAVTVWCKPGSKIATTATTTMMTPAATIAAVGGGTF